MNQVVPGTLLQISGEFQLGDGLYERDGCIYASRTGILQASTLPDGSHQIQVLSTTTRPSASGAVALSSQALLPQIGQVVLGTVLRLSSRYATIDIRVLEGASDATAVYLEDPFKGTLRQQDIWPIEEKEAPSQIYMALRPGDLVRAKIIGIGDASAGFLLSIAEDPSLGVVFAKCAATGEPLVPISWKEMMCSKSGLKEPRKPAKPQKSHITNSTTSQ